MESSSQDSDPTSHPCSGIASAFPVWKTVTVGGKGHYQLGLSMSGGRYAETTTACEMMKRLTWDFRYPFGSLPAREIDLVRVTARELGFRHGGSYFDVLAKALEIGLELCPPDAAYGLAAVYYDQPEEERLEMAMYPTPDYSNRRCVFLLDGRHSTAGYVGGFWRRRIDGVLIHANSWCNNDYVKVFVRPRKTG